MEFFDGFGSNIFDYSPNFVFIYFSSIIADNLFQVYDFFSAQFAFVDGYFYVGFSYPVRHL